MRLTKGLYNPDADNAEYIHLLLRKCLTHTWNVEDYNAYLNLSCGVNMQLSSNDTNH